MKYDVIIIGSGLGGLECGYILARQGKRVLILEQGSQPGGCLQSYKRKGLSFDTGFHYVGGLGEGESLHSVFKYLNLISLPWHQLDKYCFDKVTIGERSFDLAQGYENFCDQLAGEFPSERIGLMHYTKQLRDSITEQVNPFSPEVIHPEYMGALVTTSAWKFLEDTFHDPLLRDVLSGTSLKMELRKESLPLFSFLHGNSSYVESSWRLKGDASQIVDRLVHGIRTMGGEIICQALVTELVEKNGRLRCAVCADGERYEGDMFISGIHPAQTCDLVKDSCKLKKVFRRRIDEASNTSGMFTVSLVFPPHTMRYLNYNHYIYRKGDIWDIHEKGLKQEWVCRENGMLHKEIEEVDGVLMSSRVPEDGSEYTWQVDLLTPMPWNLCKDWQGTKVGHRDTGYEEMKEQLADKCIELVANFIPDIRGYSYRYTSTPLTWHDYTLTPEGSAYGMRKDYRNPLMTVLSPRTPIPNLLFTGQNLMMHGVHGVTMTSLHTCAAILGKEVIWKILNT